MNNELSLNDRNKILVMLMQALWGAISPNFRMVAISLEKSPWKLLFVLEKEDAIDSEEIEEIETQFGALFDSGAIEYNAEVVITADPISWPDAPWTVVFRRRED
ncbi:MAG: hypothetical protein ACK5VG_02440 [Burkholderiales bacterium]|jgi:ribosome maturation factor RimP